MRDHMGNTPPVVAYAQPFSTIAAFPLLMSLEDFVWGPADLRSEQIGPHQPQLPAKRMSNEDATGDSVAFAHDPGITEFNGMAVPVLALRCRIHRVPDRTTSLDGMCTQQPFRGMSIAIGRIDGEGRTPFLCKTGLRLGEPGDDCCARDLVPAEPPQQAPQYQTTAYRRHDWVIQDGSDDGDSVSVTRRTGDELGGNVRLHVGKMLGSIPPVGPPEEHVPRRAIHFLTAMLVLLSQLR